MSIAPTPGHIKAIDDRNAALDKYVLAEKKLGEAKAKEAEIAAQHEKTLADLANAQKNYDIAKADKEDAAEYLRKGNFKE